MRAISKSQLLAYRQCHRRLWLEARHPELREDAGRTPTGFQIGHQIGELARRLYDPKSRGITIDRSAGLDAALKQTQDALEQRRPVFEAAFLAEGGLAFADVLLPVHRAGQASWKMIEVKSSTSVKHYHCDDAAVQAFLARKSGVRLAAVSVAHIDSDFVYGGGGDYDGILIESDITAGTLKARKDVKDWLSGASSIVADPKQPSVRTGRHCNDPYECGFKAYCSAQEPQPLHPASLLPRIQTKELKAFIDAHPGVELAEIADDLLNERQQRVKSCTLSGLSFFDAAGAAADLTGYGLPVYFLDFETIQFPVPFWKGTHPYQQIPFQFSVHRLSKRHALDHSEFLDLSGSDPSKPFAEALIDRCGAGGAIFVYNAGFETARINELAKRFPRLRKALLAINERVVDLLRIAEQRYYHPDQQGSWSIKRLLPAIASDLRYDKLDGVQDGGKAMEAYLESLASATNETRKQEICEQLLAYCKLDTYAMVRIWQMFSGRQDLTL